MPQYQKAVLKSRASEAVTVLRALIDAQEVYYLIKGEYTTDMENLDISVPQLKRYENMSDDDKKRQYFYHCPEKRRCVARIDNDNLPSFEFNMHFCPASGECYPDKRWCFVQDGITKHNENARKVCETLGMTDTAYGNGKYYILN